MAIQIIDHGTSEYDKMVMLRYQILRKPLHLDFTEEELKQDAGDILIGCFEADKIIGCCVLTKMSNDTMRLRQMAVNSGLQGKGVGRVILGFAENLARDFGYKKMIMHARAEAIGFYKKLGYSTYGNEFVEVSLPHYMMEKTLKGRKLA